MTQVFFLLIFTRTLNFKILSHQTDQKIKSELSSNVWEGQVFRNIIIRIPRFLNFKISGKSPWNTKQCSYHFKKFVECSSWLGIQAITFHQLLTNSSRRGPKSWARLEPKNHKLKKNIRAPRIFSHYCLIINPLTSLFLLFIFSSSQHCTVQLLGLNIVIDERNGLSTKIAEKRQFRPFLVTSKPKICQHLVVIKPSAAFLPQWGKSPRSVDHKIWRN